MNAESALLNYEPETESEEAELLELLELERLESAYDDYGEFVRSVDMPSVPPPENEDEEDEYYPVRVEPADHHELLIDKIQDVECGDLRRLMVFMPPGSAKSTYTTVGLPPWFLGRKPRRNIICCSYGSDLATKFGRRSRSIAQTPEFESIMGVKVSKENAAAHNWTLTNGSEYMAGGLLSGITGNRADGILIDDPIKNREQADSKTIRDKAWETYKSDVRTRLKPNGWIIIIQTRWHEDDLSGRILPEGYNGESGWITARDGERWYVLSLQAEAEREDDPLGRAKGEFLWTDWYPVEHWQQEKITQGSRNWNALYQQRPTAEEGDILKRAWWNYYKRLPNALIGKIQTWDTAFKTGEENAFSVCQTWGITKSGFYLIDELHEKMEYPDLKRAIQLKFNQHNPYVVLVEDKASGTSVVQDLARETKLPLVAINPGTGNSKEMRARMAAPSLEAGNFLLPEDAPFTADLVDEAAGFPNGTFKDRVDSWSQFVNWYKDNPISVNKIKTTSAHKNKNNARFRGF